MAIHAQLNRILFGSCISLFMGVLFTFIIGDINSSHYLLELMTLMLVEIPLIAMCALLVRKFDWQIGFLFVFLGTAASYAMIFPETSLTPFIFLKIGFMGMILGKKNWFSGSFFKRISAVSVPGIIFALFFGLPIVFHGVSPDTLEEIKNDSLEIYQAFMTEDEALNAIDNAMIFFEGIFRIGFAFYFLFALILSWLSFYFTGWLMERFNEAAEYVPPVYFFKIPFHAIWVLIVGGALCVSGYEPFYPVAYNILAIMAGLYGIQGLAIVTYHINGISMGRLPKILFWVILFLAIGFTGIFMIFTGIIDNWFNLRSIKYHKEVEKEGNNDESDS